jgi:hypothetical protein
VKQQLKNVHHENSGGAQHSTFEKLYYFVPIPKNDKNYSKF